MKSYLAVAAVAVAFVSPAYATTTILNTGLADVSGTAGSGAALVTGTTATTVSGTRTSVTGLATSGNRVSATPVAGTWFQANVGAGSTVGITTDYAKDGNGSAYFSIAGNSGKADLQYYFAQPVALSSLTSMSYSYYRDSASTVAANLAPTLRLDVLRNGSFAGSLVLESVYQTNPQGNVALDSWTTVSADLTHGIIWATNAAMGPKNAAAAGGQKTFATWLADNGTASITVKGMSFGAGSGWGAGKSFVGAIDDVHVAFANGPNVTYNFEVAAVPEPSSWAMMLAGFGAIGLTLRRRPRAPAASRG